MGNIFSSKKTTSSLSSNLLKRIEYDVHRKNNIFPNVFFIFQNNLKESDFFNRMEYVSQFAEKYFKQETKITDEITAALEESLKNINEDIDNEVDIIDICLLRSKWLELNWEVFQLYYNTLDWLQPSMVLSFDYLPYNSDILIEETPVLFNEIFNKYNNWNKIEKNINLMRIHREEIESIQRQIDTTKEQSIYTTEEKRTKLMELKDINSKIQNSKRTQVYKLLKGIVNKEQTKLLELWQLYRKGGDKMSCITLTKSQNITNSNLVDNNVLNKVSNQQSDKNNNKNNNINKQLNLFNSNRSSTNSSITSTSNNLLNNYIGGNKNKRSKRNILEKKIKKKSKNNK